MVRAWYMDNCEGDQRDEHMRSPDSTIDLDVLKNKTGVLYFTIPLTNGEYEEEPKLQKIRKDRGYSYTDVIDISPQKLPNYEEKLKIFFKEHIHSDEEIRLCIKGSGYFDVRDKNDEWIRVEMSPGDMIILPAGIYHRFTLDRKNYIKAMRFFVGEPVWTPINRPTADDHPARISYVNQLVEA